jgi:50S ribosomal protein L16 3-hydroxylase
MWKSRKLSADQRGGIGIEATKPGSGVPGWKGFMTRTSKLVPRPDPVVEREPPSGGSFIGDLLGGIGLNDFLCDTYLRQPYAASGEAWRVVRTVTADDVDRLVLDPGCDLLASHGGRCVASLAEDRKAALASHRERHCSLAIRHAERHHAALAGIAAAALLDLAGEVDVQIHSAPAGSPGFGWHFDPEEVFIVQCAGAKDWSVRANTVHPDPVLEAMPARLEFDREISPILRCRLEPGDWLYIPGGWWHVGQAVDDSLSLAIGVMALTPLQILDAVRKDLVGSSMWRQRLPPPRHPESVHIQAALLSSSADELGRRLVSEKIDGIVRQQRRQAALLMLGQRSGHGEEARPRSAMGA